MSILPFVLLALVAGALLPIQSGANAELARRLGSPFAAALTNFAVGTAALVVLTLGAGRPAPGVSSLLRAPWWTWIGGLLGAGFVAIAIVVIPRVGAVGQLAAMLAGWMVGSLVVDHFGLMHLPVREISGLRVAGVVLIASGAALVLLAQGR